MIGCGDEDDFSAAYKGDAAGVVDRCCEEGDDGRCRGDWGEHFLQMWKFNVCLKIKWQVLLGELSYMEVMNKRGVKRP